MVCLLLSNHVTTISVRNDTDKENLFVLLTMKANTKSYLNKKKCGMAGGNTKNRNLIWLSHFRTPTYELVIKQSWLLLILEHVCHKYIIRPKLNVVNGILINGLLTLVT